MGIYTELCGFRVNIRKIILVYDAEKGFAKLRCLIVCRTVCREAVMPDSQIGKIKFCSAASCFCIAFFDYCIIKITNLVTNQAVVR